MGCFSEFRSHLSFLLLLVHNNSSKTMSAAVPVPHKPFGRNSKANVSVIVRAQTVFVKRLFLTFLLAEGTGMHGFV